MSEGDSSAGDILGGDEPWFRRYSIRYRLTDALSRLTKGWVRSPCHHSIARIHAEHEADDQAECRIGPDDHVRIHSLWAAEFYTPETIGKLYDGLARLKPFGMSRMREHPIDWLRSGRASRGSWHEVALASPGKRQPLSDGFYCPYPFFAKDVNATILCISPSLTMLVTHFRVDPSESDWLDAELHKDRPARTVPARGGGSWTYGPQLEQRRIVAEKRAQWLDAATHWYRTHFPGLLSSRGDRIPMCEFSTIEGASPFGSGEASHNLLEAVGFSWSPELYQGSNGVDDDAFLLSLVGFGDGMFGPDEMIYLTAEQDKFLALDAAIWGGDIPQLNLLDNRFRRTFAAQAIWQVLRCYARRAAAARDDAASILGGRATKALAKLRAESAGCIDAATISREILTALDTNWPRLHRMPFTERDMIGPPKRGRKKAAPATLQENCRARLEQDARSLLANVEELNAGLNAQANLLGAHANLKLQPWIILLAVLSLAAGVAAAIEPVEKFLRPMLP